MPREHGHARAAGELCEVVVGEVERGRARRELLAGGGGAARVNGGRQTQAVEVVLRGGDVLCAGHVVVGVWCPGQMVPGGHGAQAALVALYVVPGTQVQLPRSEPGGWGMCWFRGQGCAEGRSRGSSGWRGRGGRQWNRWGGRRGGWCSGRRSRWGWGCGAAGRGWVRGAAAGADVERGAGGGRGGGGVEVGAGGAGAGGGGVGGSKRKNCKEYNWQTVRRQRRGSRL